jgi:hypothetical protein
MEISTSPGAHEGLCTQQRTRSPQLTLTLTHTPSLPPKYTCALTLPHTRSHAHTLTYPHPKMRIHAYTLAHTHSHVDPHSLPHTKTRTRPHTHHGHPLTLTLFHAHIFTHTHSLNTHSHTKPLSPRCLDIPLCGCGSVGKQCREWVRAPPPGHCCVTLVKVLSVKTSHIAKEGGAAQGMNTCRQTQGTPAHSHPMLEM